MHNPESRPAPGAAPPAAPPPDPIRALRRGLRDAAPFLVIILPFSTLFGVAARDAGLDLLQVTAMSAIVIAGASQFTALSLMTDGAPVVVTVLAALAVNLRMAMYSAALVPHLGAAPLGMRALMSYVMVDQVFALSQDRLEREPGMPLAEKTAYYFGTVLAIIPVWFTFAFLGALIGRTLPPALAADFAVPVCFIALIAPMLRSLPHVVAAFASVAGALAFAFVPWNLGLIFAAGLAMSAGAQTEFWLARRAARQAAAQP